MRESAYLVRARHMCVEDVECNLVNERMCDPGAVMPISDLAQLVCLDLVHSDLIRLRIVLNRDICGHAAHSRNLSPA